MNSTRRDTLSEQVLGMATDVVDEALGRESRQDPVEAGSGGPAGNARLTAWTGMALLVLFFAEGLTLLDVRGLISWHIVIGVLLVPPALLKTGTTGWRIVRYYLGHPSYKAAGPPVLLLRLLGPLVIATSIGVLASGLVLIYLGPESSRSQLLGLNAVNLHKLVFLLWAAVMAAHVLSRLIPALRLTVLPAPGSARVPGVAWRAIAMILTAAVAALTAGLVLSASGAWRTQFRPDGRPPGSFAPR